MSITIALHGALGTASQFSALNELLDSPVIAIDLPGHGGVPASGPFSNALFANAVLAKMSELGAETVDLLGYSMGGYIALWMAWQYPQKIRSVTILNTKLNWTPETATKMTGMFDVGKIEAKAPQLAEAFAAAHAPGDWKELSRQTADFLLNLGNGASIPEAAFKNIICPVKILRGALDQVVSEEECQQVAALIPLANYYEIADSKHPIELVNTAALASYLQ